MRKKLSYVVVIMTTIFCVMIILYSNDIPQISFDNSSMKRKLEDLTGSKKSEASKNKVIVNKQANTNSAANNATKPSTTDDKTLIQPNKDKNSDVNDTKADSSSNNTSNETDINGTQNIDNSNTSNNENSSVDNNSKVEENTTNDQNDYLKEPINSIIKDMSFMDKARLLSIANKISPTDYAKINNYLSDGNSNNSVKNVYEILKTKLSKKDFAEFQQVASKYVYLDKLEK